MDSCHKWTQLHFFSFKFLYISHIQFNSPWKYIYFFLFGIRTGSERSSLYCTVSILLERLKLEGRVDVLNCLRQIKLRRQTAFPTTVCGCYFLFLLNEIVKANTLGVYLKVIIWVKIAVFIHPRIETYRNKLFYVFGKHAYLC